MYCGFCGKSICRISWQGGEGRPRRFGWQCVSRLKDGKKKCLYAASLAEETIYVAFIASYNDYILQLIDNGQELLASYQARLEEALEQKRAVLEEQRIFLKQQILQGFSDMLDEKMSRTEYYEKYAMMFNQLENTRFDLKQICDDREGCRQKCMEKARNLLINERKLTKFSQEVFYEVIDHVEIGGFDEHGEPVHTRIRFIYKADWTDDRMAKDYKPKRKRRTKAQLEKDRMLLAGSNEVKY